MCDGLSHFKNEFYDRQNKGHFATIEMLPLAIEETMAPICPQNDPSFCPIDVKKNVILHTHEHVQI